MSLSNGLNLERTDSEDMDKTFEEDEQSSPAALGFEDSTNNLDLGASWGLSSFLEGSGNNASMSQSPRCRQTSSQEFNPFSGGSFSEALNGSVSQAQNLNFNGQQVTSNYLPSNHFDGNYNSSGSLPGEENQHQDGYLNNDNVKTTRTCSQEVDYFWSTDPDLPRLPGTHPAAPTLYKCTKAKWQEEIRFTTPGSQGQDSSQGDSYTPPALYIANKSEEAFDVETAESDEKLQIEQLRQKNEELSRNLLEMYKYAQARDQAVQSLSEQNKWLYINKERFKNRYRILERAIVVPDKLAMLQERVRVNMAKQQDQERAMGAQSG